MDPKRSTLRPLRYPWGRVAGGLLLAATVWYVPWFFRSLNWGALWLALPFAFATAMMVIMTTITVINHWTYAAPVERRVAKGDEPDVAVIIPTLGEPPEMIYRTARSVLDQDYPPQRIQLTISDDNHRPAVREVVDRLAQQYPDALITYHEPPRRGDPRRRGEAKAGNLNSVLDLINGYLPAVDFVETRDADDLVGDPTFLRQAIGQLQADPRLAFVQTLKESVVSWGDPFGNQEPLFYRSAMLARNVANAVFPCGSGLVWRRAALNDIGGFPTWNLVEDLQSGVEALRRGWRSLYVPIVGALGQTAPEDLPNTIKQRGTWAIDTMRLSFWGPKRGLSLGQHLQFAELGFFYLLSVPILIFCVTPIIALTFDIYPLVTTHAAYTLYFWPYALAIELVLISFGKGLPYEALWRARQIWLGMAPVYARAALIALLYGPKRKPIYRVTRKEHRFAWYWREAWLQIVLALGLMGASVYHVATHPLLSTADLGSMFWSLFFLLGLSRTIRNSWHGLGLRARAMDRLRRLLGLRRRPEPQPEP